MQSNTGITWNGAVSRSLKLQRPCPCGCDFRGGIKGVGYLTGSDANGNGFTQWIENEAVYLTMESLIKESSVISAE